MADAKPRAVRTVRTGPWVGVKYTPEPFDDNTETTLQLAVNAYFPDAVSGSGLYARPGFVRPQSVSSANNGQGVHAHVASDGQLYNFFVVNGALYRWSTDLTSAPVNVTPTSGGTIAPTGRVSFVSMGDVMIVNDGQNIPWIATN
jgi:hypothetical protein